MKLKPGTQHTFSHILKNNSNNPVIPTEPGTFKILDKDGDILTEGRLMRGYEDGEFQTIWHVPTSNVNNPYVMVFSVKDKADGTINDRINFEIEVEEDPDYNYINLLTYGSGRLSLSFSETGSYEFKIYADGSEPEVTFTHKVESVGANIKTIIDNDDLKALTVKDYSAFVTKVNAEGEAIDEPMILNFSVCPARFWNILPRLRTYIDRYHKSELRINGYTDEMCWTWIVEGLSKINSLPTPTNYRLNNFPKEPNDYGLVGLLIKAAALSCLRSQALVEGELAFDYSGPNVTVNRDALGPIESEIGRLESELEEAIRNAKRLAKVNTGPVGILSNRKPGARHWGRSRRIR